MRVFNILKPPLVAIDVGTSSTRVSFGGSHLIEAPSIVREATANGTVSRATMRAGVVADIAGTAAVIAPLLRDGGKGWWQHPGALICTPTDASEEERDALAEAVSVAGASVAAIVPEPLAAAVGAGVDIPSDYATAVVDIGDGVTDLAVFRNAAMIHSAALRTGCGELRCAVQDWMELQHGFTLPDLLAEELVRSFCRLDVRLPRVPIPSSNGLRRFVERDDLAILLDPVLDSMAAFVGRFFRDLPDRVAAEVIESGITLSGGGATLPRLVERIEARVGIPVDCASEPLTAVIRGAREMLSNRQLLQLGA